MLLQYFGFQEEPFGVTPDPRFLYPSQTHLESLASLEYSFKSNRGFTAMIAPPGMGKTTLLYRFLERAQESAYSVFLFDIDALSEPQEFMGSVLRKIGITPKETSSEMQEQLKDVLIKENAAGRKFVLVIDEAQNLSDAVLERVRLLTNVETTRGKLLQIVLSGQPQLSDKLLNPSLIQLRQRISTICRLDPLSREDVAAYIDYRLKRVGYNGKPLFNENALKEIAEASQGIPRTINNLCFNALSLCCALKGRQVDESMVAEVISDLRLIPQSNGPVSAIDEVTANEAGKPENQGAVKRSLKGWASAAAVLLVCVLGAFAYTHFGASHSQGTGDTPSLSRKSFPPSSSQRPTADAGEALIPDQAASASPFAVTVAANQSLGDISIRYLGGFDLPHLHQIQRLNPKLTNPDHVEVGQKVWLPGPPNTANTPAQRSIEQAQDAGVSSAGDTNKFLTAQLTDGHKKLQDSENDLQSYASQTRIVIPSSSQRSAAAGKLRQIQTDPAKAESHEADTQAQVEVPRNYPSAAMPQVLDEPTLRNNRARLADLRRQLSDLSVTLTPQDYRIQQLHAQIADLEQQFSHQRANIIKRLGVQTSAAAPGRE
ncbi:MAG: AAA family ATPase [Acidobacteriaceae bacterium]